ncbi:rod shape-determining protein [Myxococcota bacterium]|nr:rod shape-determining protein [Myxococcota bacterium]
MLDQALGRLSSDLAIDLGTSNTLVLVRSRGIVVEEPSVVAVQRGPAGTQVVAVGAEAKRMVGRTPENIQAVRPIREGVIADFELAETLLRTCVDRALGSRPLVKPRMVVCVPVGTTEVERRAILESARAAGGREVRLVGKSTAAALGAELPIHEARASMVVDIGGGTTEIGLISMGGVVVNASVRAAGDHLDRALVAAIQQRHNTLIGERTAEELKLRIGRALPAADDVTPLRVKGRDLGTGIPRDVTITSAEVVAAFQPVLEEIVEGIRRALSRTPPELAADVLQQGFVLCGGGALLPDIDALLRARTGVPVVMAEDPRRCAVIGAGDLLEDPETLERVSPLT